jgi:hypothetical protein
MMVKRRIKRLEITDRIGDGLLLLRISSPMFSKE